MRLGRWGNWARVGEWAPSLAHHTVCLYRHHPRMPPAGFPSALAGSAHGSWHRFSPSPLSKDDHNVCRGPDDDAIKTPSFWLQGSVNF